MTDSDGGAWFKGNVHAHSLWSDGDDYPEMIVDWYRQHGYQFLALSDHNVLSIGERWLALDPGDVALARYQQRFPDGWVETRPNGAGLEVRLKTLAEFRSMFEVDGQFLLLQAEEITDHFRELPIHLIASNVAERIDPQGGRTVAETIKNNLAAAQQQSRRLGIRILLHAAHPNFHYAITAEDLAQVTTERFFEIYNGHPEVNQTGDAHHASVEQLWDIMNTLRLGEFGSVPMYGLAVDDSHHYAGGPASPGRGWIMVRAVALAPDPLITAIENGDFYASTGVSLHDVRYCADTGVLALAIDTEPGTAYTTRFIGTPRRYDHTSEPILDESGHHLPVTRRYSADVGQVLATSESENPQYRMGGHELYVRAVVTASRSPENPSYPGQLAQAWTQPVGWTLPK